MKSLDNFSTLELLNVEDVKGGCAYIPPPCYNPYSVCNPCEQVAKKTKKSKKSKKGKSKKSIKCK